MIQRIADYVGHSRPCISCSLQVFLHCLTYTKNFQILALHSHYSAIPPYQNRKNSAHNHLWERLCWLSFGMNEGYFWSITCPGGTLTSATNADLKYHLHPVIKSKQRGCLSTGVLLQHDNARPHTACSTVAAIQDLSFECLPHLSYSQNLSSSDFHVFGPLKETMGGRSFRSD
jgi:hypothetical protein